MTTETYIDELKKLEGRIIWLISTYKRLPLQDLEIVDATESLIGLEDLPDTLDPWDGLREFIARGEELSEYEDYHYHQTVRDQVRDMMARAGILNEGDD